MNYKKIIVGLAIAGSIMVSHYIGKGKGYTQGFEDTKTEIRKDAANTYDAILRKEKEAANLWWNSSDTNKTFTRGEAHRFERNAFSNSRDEISDLILLNIDRLNEKDLKRIVEFNKKYDK